MTNTPAQHTQLKHHISKLHSQAKHKLATRHKKAWTKIKRANMPIEHLVHRTGQAATTIALTGALLNPSHAISTSVSTLLPSISRHDTDGELDITRPVPPQYVALQRSLVDLLPTKPGMLSAESSLLATQRIKALTGITAKSELDGFRLNADFGYMGAEQHLPRFPGDTIAKHDEYQRSGITRSRGAFGYFARSEAELTEEAFLQEKYYMVVQTFLSPQWSHNSHAFKDWIKFRKVLVVNTKTGRTIVGAIGDAGPAKWTGKQFGGSPEVVRYLNDGKQNAKTSVVVLFIDDPDDQIPLGPVL